MMGKRHLHEADSPIATFSDPTARPPMLHPSDRKLSKSSPSATVARRPSPVQSCGCRLVAAGEAWFHFSPLAGRDARGCRVDCADAAHDASGRPTRSRSRRVAARAAPAARRRRSGSRRRGPRRSRVRRPPRPSTRRRARCGFSHSRSGSVSAGQPARASWWCGTMSPAARTSASSSRNSVGVRVSEASPTRAS